MYQTATLDRLRSQFFRFSGAHMIGNPGLLKLHLPEIERHLPWHGLPRGALHELAGEHHTVSAFLAAILGRDTRSADVLWVTPRARLYAQDLAQMGLDHRRVTIVSTNRADDRLWAGEEGLRELGYGAVVIETETTYLAETRRLQVAAKKSGNIGFLIRRDNRQPSAALTGWQLQAADSDGYRPCWQVSLERYRDATVGLRWDVEWDYEAKALRPLTPWRINRH
ncbi:ImuA family protein [Ferrovibrio sp.]|uniref:ImuA family protein n=1 Tax=Ferrovibrio sp. TaxID=1917215 RepID=UPI0035B2489F